MLWLWAGFLIFVILMLALDLGVFHREAHVVSLRESLIWSTIWIVLSLLFVFPLYWIYSTNFGGVMDYDPDVLAASPSSYPDSPWKACVMYLTGYLTEKSLSVDNIFVIALIFALFQIPDRYQHRVLFYGILGALIMRAVFIVTAVELLEKFHWIIYIFGAFLIFTSLKLLFAGEPDPAKSLTVRLCYKFLPITNTLHGQKFLIPRSELAATEKIGAPPTETHPESSDGLSDEGLAEPVSMDAAPEKTNLPESRRSAAYFLTPLGLALIVVEVTDLIFAVDSIPAIVGITRDRFLVFTSNIFAILGLRALYFALSGIIRKFHHLDEALAIVLGYIGVKMVCVDLIHKVPWLEANLPYITLGVILITLTGGIVASLVFPAEDEDHDGEVSDAEALRQATDSSPAS